MNYVGHIAAGLTAGGATGADDEFLVGTALPDFSAMARVRLRRGGQGPVAAGIAAHRVTDARFHGLEWFRSTTGSLRAALVADGMAAGPARAAAHVLPELALDGRLMARPEVAAAVEAVLQRVSDPEPALVALVAPEHGPRWSAGLRAIGTRSDPAGYRDPARVAERVCAATRGRPRIEVPTDHLATLERHAAALLAADGMDDAGILAAVVA